MSTKQLGPSNYETHGCKTYIDADAYIHMDVKHTYTAQSFILERICMFLVLKFAYHTELK